ncbi:MAG: hypothetical protein OXJ37_02290 [Bryobacterales bacterium]|nr:hypothetical protein [Bryobacterales bacterium]MDE0261221.1 hypothetical protein [Bryobacterales bacterium]
MSSIDQLTPAVSRGLGFLEDHQHSDGHWQDFSVPFESDMWVTAYVGTMVSEISLGNTRPMAERSHAWLQQAANRGRWAFADVAALDADSTIWASRLGEQLGFGISSETLEFLHKHVCEDGHIAMYIHEDFLERYGEDYEMQSPGWYCGHPCVTSAASSLIGLPWRDRVVRALSLAQQSTGSWQGYWCIDPEYATALSIEGLHGSAEYAKNVEAAAQWLSRRARDGAVSTAHFPQGSAFATGFALRGLVMAGELGPVQERIGTWLASAQRPDGSWSSSAALLMPNPHMMRLNPLLWLPGNRKRTHWETIFLDQYRLHTTATVINALWRLLAAMEQKGDADPSAEGAEHQGIRQ